MFKNHFGETVVIVLAMVMGFIMSLAVILIDQLGLNGANIFKIWSMITMVILLASIFIPYKEWSGKLTGRVCKDQGSVVYKLVDNILPSLILNTCNTLIVSAANIFYNEAIPSEMWISDWLRGILRDWPITFVVSYFVAFIAEAVGKWVAEKYCN